MRSGGGGGTPADTSAGTPAGTGPRPSAVPRLPLASMSRTGSAASSVAGSARLSSRENTAQHLHQQLLAGRASAGNSSSSVGGRPAVPGGAPQWHAAPAGAPLPQRSASKESHISLTELLSTPGSISRAVSAPAAPAAPAAAARQGSSATPRHSSFSVASAASAAASRAAASVPADATAAVATSAEPEPAAAAAPPAAVPQAPASSVVPGETAAPPLQDTPRQPTFSEQTPRAQAADAAGAASLCVALRCVGFPGSYSYALRPAQLVCTSVHAWLLWQQLRAVLSMSGARTQHTLPLPCPVCRRRRRAALQPRQARPGGAYLRAAGAPLWKAAVAAWHAARCRGLCRRCLSSCSSSQQGWRC